MLQSGNTSVLGRAYDVYDVLPLPVPAGSRRVVDRLGIPSARRRGGGDLEGNLCRASPRPGTEVCGEGEGEGGGQHLALGVRPALPLPLLI